MVNADFDNVDLLPNHPIFCEDARLSGRQKLFVTFHEYWKNYGFIIVFRFLFYSVGQLRAQFLGLGKMLISLASLSTSVWLTK
jgi:hypothetical protein